LTGILGVNRDVLGTGLGARPLFNTDILCFAYPDDDLPKRPKLLPPATIINGVRKGIQDGGNKSGIPTVNGAIVFDRGYRAKPLVFCGTGGILPLNVRGMSGFEKHTKPGDKIVMAGGRVGKDGVHGATFSSEALHEGSPVSAVQIGDPFTQKRLLDFVLEARDLGLITGITDNGAGGLSSSVGEMAQITGGATIELDKVPTKYAGLADWEIVVSESQERMTSVN
jgi:phosphoribosylformylglycinamidine (FGAM) synthase-like enzyme